MSESVLTAVLFTDVVDSTAIGARLGPERNEELRSTHFAILREVIDKSAGVEVKNLGDGLMVTYASPRAALGGAITMQRAIARHNQRSDEPLRIRIGLSVGEAYIDEGDYFGEPVVEAARLCGAAEGGQILTTDMVRRMAGRASDIEFAEVGALTLKGIPEPVPACAVVWDTAEMPSGVPLPTSLITAEDDGLFSFVGRVAELDQIEQIRKESATAGVIRTMLVGGEAGIGKSAMVARVAAGAHAEGAIVLAGHCDEDVAEPHQLWRQTLAHLLQHMPELGDRLSPRHRAAVARLVPTYRGPDAAAVEQIDHETDRFMLMTAVEALLHEASEEGPVVLVLDDLHWADSASLHALRHVLSSGRSMSLVVLGTFRHTDLGTSDPLTALLADLHRLPGVARLRLSGLDEEETVRLVESASGGELDEVGVAFVHALRHDTAGNPFFTREIVRHVVEANLVGERDGGWDLSTKTNASALPASVRDVVMRRVARVGEEAGSVLAIAAVLGRQFDLDLLAEVSGREIDDLIDVLDAAVVAAIVAEQPDTPGVYRFAHDLTQQTLYEGLGGARRVRTHQLAAEALERSATGVTAAEVARHLVAAVRMTDSDRVLAYLSRAADDALADLAPHDAIAWYQQALDLADDTGAGDDVRGRLLVGQGTAQRYVGDVRHRAALLEAADLARRLGDDGLLIDAILAADRGIAGTSAADREWVLATEAALVAVGEADSVARSRLLSLLSQTIDAHDWQRRRELSIDAVSIARRLADRSTLAAVLPVAYQHYLPEEIDDRLEITELAVTLSEDARDPIATCNALFHRIDACMQIGAIGEADRLLERLDEEARSSALPLPLWQSLMTLSMRSLLRGEIATAETEASEAFRVGSASGQAEAPLVLGTQLLEIRRHQGRLDEVVPLLLDSAGSATAVPGFRQMLAGVLAEIGRVDEAASAYAPDRDAGFGNIPRDAAWLLLTTSCASTAADLGDQDACRILYELLAPHAHRIVATYAANSGAVSRFLGRLALVRGDHDAAVAHLETALVSHEGLEAPYWIARTRLDLCDTLIARGHPTDRDRVAALTAEATSAAQRYGYAGLASRATALDPSPG